MRFTFGYAFYLWSMPAVEFYLIAWLLGADEKGFVEWYAEALLKPLIAFDLACDVSLDPSQTTFQFFERFAHTFELLGMSIATYLYR